MPRWSIGYTPKRVCPECGGKKQWDSKTCRKCQQKPKGQLGKKGSDHPAWKGGSRIDRDGYIKTYAPDHPWPRKSGYVFEHVRVMEILIGRRVGKHEVVHHRNRNRQDNRLDNLELMTASQHSSHHRKLDTHRRQRIKGKFARKGGV